MGTTVLTLPLYLWTMLPFAFNDSGETSLELLSLIHLCLLALGPVLLVIVASCLKVKKINEWNTPLYYVLLSIVPLCITCVIFYEFSTLSPVLSLRNAILDYKVNKFMGDDPQFLDSYQNEFREEDLTSYHEYYLSGDFLIEKVVVDQHYMVSGYKPLEKDLFLELLQYINQDQKDAFSGRGSQSQKDLYAEEYYVSDNMTIVFLYSDGYDREWTSFVQIGDLYYLTKIGTFLNETPYSDYIVYASDLRTKDFPYGYSPDFEHSPSFTIVKSDYFVDSELLW
ncbi:MAG: hypothetical protein R3Y07_07205 [Eubacteriales bacterium]